MTGRRAELLGQLRRAVSWHRRLLAALAAAAAVALALGALSPAAGAGELVLVAGHDLPAGHVLTAGDVVARPLPPEAVPDGALRPGAGIAGRLLASPLRRGEPVTDVRLMSASALGRAAAAGLVATPVRLADADTAALLHAGDVVDVIAAYAPGADGSPARARVVAAGVRVVTVPAAGDRGLAGDGALVVLATTPATATALAEASVAARLSVVMRGQG